MQPSEYEIQREVEALRDIRRRSTTPGALTIDPDLPNQSPPSSQNAAFWSGNTTPSLIEEESSVSSHEGDSTSSHIPNNPTDDPFHLFWVPAGLHPEIAPAEFRAFLKEHARAPGPDGIVSPQRSNSVVSTTSLDRKKSMLSRQYRPSENDGVENEAAPLRRKSSVLNNVGPQLTISDLQRLDELAEEASESSDPTRLRNVLRRSLSLNLSPLAVEQMEDAPDMGDEADAPIIVPPPGQILRRAARTKIRKPGLPGDGGGHRFGASRRITRPQTAATGSPTSTDQRSSSDQSSSDHGDLAERPEPRRSRTFSNGSSEGGFSEEASIYDSYARGDDESEDHAPVVITSPPPAQVPLPASLVVEPQRDMPAESTGPVLHHPQPQRLLAPQAQQPYPSRTPSPSDDGSHSSANAPSRSPEPPSFLSTSPTPSHQRKDKDKKGLFGKWGGDKGGKKNGKERERENQQVEEEKGGSFFGSLFGSKKKQEENVPLGLGAASGREAAAALLGASKSSKSYQPPLSPSNIGAANNYARYPIHVERAIYRLSHIKLANPRRPLYEQVLISNLMFWYLGVINKTTPASGTNTPNGTASEKEQKEKEQKEREEEIKAEKEKERLEKERELEQKKKEAAPRRGSLTKATPAGTPGGRRAAEMPVRGPQYEMQHRVMEQEYGGFGGGGGGQSPPNHGPPPMGRVSSAPPPGPQLGRPKIVTQQQQPQAPLPLAPHQQQLQHLPSPEESYYYKESVQYAPSPQLPPGAMPPAMNKRPSSSPNTIQGGLPPGAVDPRRSRSPPGHQPNHAAPLLPSQNNLQPVLSPNRYVPSPQEALQSGRPARSLSAAAAAPPPPGVNGKLRKGISAHAVVANGRRPRTAEGPQSHVGEEEDVPLAVWQRQQRR